MRLVKLVLQGYKRFQGPTTLEADDRLVALVGPNEAGKTSVLAALKHLDHDEPWGSREATLGYTGNKVIRATFVLDDADRQALSAVPLAGSLEHVIVEKGPDGQRRFLCTPDLGPNLAPRVAASAALERLVGDPIFNRSWNATPAVDSPTLDNVREILKSEDHLSIADIAAVRSVADAAQAADISWEAAPESEPPPSDADGIAALVALLRAAADAAQQVPNDEAMAILRPRLPRIVEFSVSDRDLLHEYPLGELPSSGALANLAELAGFELPALVAAYNDHDGVAIEELQAKARARLDEAFSSDRYRQADLEVRVTVPGEVLQIAIRDRGHDHFLYLNERSAGLQWFVALSAFIERYAKRRDVILLIDEAEQHLHYDAQADLIAILNDPLLAQQVIYSTHSAGCLPPDLGRGVRAIVPSGPSTEHRSTIETGFWDEGPGFSRMLLGMGASVLAFTVPSCLLICEGATEAILLPTLLRIANATDDLGYQVAPGLANTDPTDFKNLVDHAGRSAFLCDCDDDGLRYRRRLERVGVPTDRVFDLLDLAGVSDLNTEELVSPDLYVEVVNEVVHEHNRSAPVLTAGELPGAKWASAFEAWCEANHLSIPSKRVIAQRIVDKTRRMKDQAALNPAHVSALVKLHERLTALFE